MMNYPLLAHVGESHAAPEIASVMTGWELFKTSWHWDPLAVGGVAVAMGAYLFLVRFKWDKHTVYFTLGNTIILIALVSPIATIGETYLFSVHMVQHLLLEIVAVPLLILGIPAKLAGYFMRWKPLRALANVLGVPLIAWLIGVTTLWIWHWPTLYNLTLENKAIHVLEHISFVISATIFWYAVLDPIEKYRLKTLPALFYLFSAGLANTLLAILLTFAPEGLYPYYLNPNDSLGALSLIREKWGILPHMDQQMGGAIMWVMGGMVFTLIVILLLARFYNTKEEF